MCRKVIHDKAIKFIIFNPLNTDEISRDLQGSVTTFRTSILWQNEFGENQYLSLQTKEIYLGSEKLKIKN